MNKLLQRAATKITGKKEPAIADRFMPEGAVRPLGTRAIGGKPRLKGVYLTRISDGYPSVDGPHYIDIIQELHNILKPQWYLEIGTSFGFSLRVCPGNFVAIDPEFAMQSFEMKSRTQGHFLQMTSDDAFASGFLSKNDIRPAMGFLDGMHLFEYLLRDFMNFEKSCLPGAVALLHDCLPANPIMVNREWVKGATVGWTGDVWKTRVILQEVRPDLTIRQLDSYPSGLVVISGLDPENRMLDGAYDEMVAKYRDMTLEDYGLQRYFEGLPIESGYKFIEDIQPVSGV